MKHTTLSLGDVKPSRFRDLASYPLDAGKVEALRGSIRNTAFWEDLPVRETSEGWELIFGHHRMAAALEELGPDFVASFSVHDIDDDEALRRMADENSDVWATDPKHVALVVKQARDRLDALLDEAPTWEQALQHPVLGTVPDNYPARSEPRCVLWFGPASAGPGTLARCVEQGVGRETIAAYIDPKNPERWIGKVRAGLNLIGPSAKRQAYNAALAEAKAADSRAATDAVATASKEDRPALQAAAEKAALAEAEAVERAARDSFVQRNFDPGVIPGTWNMHQAQAFFKAVTSPLTRSIGGIPVEMQAKIVAGIEALYQQTPNGPVAARSAAMDPSKAPLTAVAISSYVADFVNEVVKARMRGDTADKIVDDPKVALRSAVKTEIERATVKIIHARKAIASLTGRLINLGEPTEDFQQWIDFDNEVKALASRVDEVRKLAATKSSKTKGDGQSVVHLIKKGT